MVSTTSRSTQETVQARLEEKIKRHKEEVARWREQNGDPAEALDRFILERFSLEALLPEEQFVSEDIVSESKEGEGDELDAR